MKRIAYLMIALSLMVALSGCAKKPEQEIKEAREAVDAVVALGGERYAAEELRQLTDSLNAAMNEVNTQDAKFIKNYDKAKEMLSKVNAGAEKLKAEIPVRKEKARNDALAALETAKASVGEAKALLSKAPGGKGSRADIEALRADVSGLEASLEDVNGLIAAEDYLSAIDKSNAINEKALEVKTQVTQAIEKVKAAKKRKK